MRVFGLVVLVNLGSGTVNAVAEAFLRVENKLVAYRFAYGVICNDAGGVRHYDAAERLAESVEIVG